jgi:hypothetical protein
VATVVGRAADYMPYFIYAFSKMGEEGVAGDGRVQENAAATVSDAAN